MTSLRHLHRCHDIIYSQQPRLPAIRVRIRMKDGAAITIPKGHYRTCGPWLVIESGCLKSVSVLLKNVKSINGVCP